MKASPHLEVSLPFPHSLETGRMHSFLQEEAPGMGSQIHSLSASRLHCVVWSVANWRLKSWKKWMEKLWEYLANRVIEPDNYLNKKPISVYCIYLKDCQDCSDEAWRNGGALLVGISPDCHGMKISIYLFQRKMKIVSYSVIYYVHCNIYCNVCLVQALKGGYLHLLWNSVVIISFLSWQLNYFSLNANAFLIGPFLP